MSLCPVLRPSSQGQKKGIMYYVMSTLKISQTMSKHALSTTMSMGRVKSGSWEPHGAARLESTHYKPSRPHSFSPRYIYISSANFENLDHRHTCPLLLLPKDSFDGYHGRLPWSENAQVWKAQLERCCEGSMSDFVELRTQLMVYYVR